MRDAGIGENGIVDGRQGLARLNAADPASRLLVAARHLTYASHPDTQERSEY